MEVVDSGNVAAVCTSISRDCFILGAVGSFYPVAPNRKWGQRGQVAVKVGLQRSILCLSAGRRSRALVSASGFSQCFRSVLYVQ